MWYLVIGIVPYAGIDLATNSLLKEVIGDYLQRRGREPGVPLLLACGMASSTTAMIFTYPLNLLRTRLQASGMPGTAVYDSATDCFKRTVATEGLRGLYRGIGPVLARAVPVHMAYLPVYDHVESAMRQ